MAKRSAFLKQLIAQQRALNLAPCELHMSATTRDDFSREIAQEMPDRRSLFDRIRNVPAPPYKCEIFEGLRVVENEMLQGSAIVLRPMQLMNDPWWLQRILFQDQTGQQSSPMRPQAAQGGRPVPLPADGSTPWHQRVQEAPQTPSEDDPVTVDSLADGGGVNPTTCILKALDGLDGVEDVVVVRFHRNRDVSLCSTLDRHGVAGALQKALGYALHEGD
jgi:hypothetical protein